MIFSTSPSYTDSSSPTHAIVMGGSIAGLLSARVLLDHFDQVTLLERDRFPESPETRTGVPQGAHAHVLLMRGLAIIEDLFPGIVEDLIADGAEVHDWINNWKVFSIWGYLEQHDSGLRSLCCSRLLIEYHLRKRLLAYSNFALRSGCSVQGVTLMPSDSRVSGVRYRCKDGGEEQSVTPQEIQSTLVVDAMGRQSTLSQQLGHAGFDSPPITVVNSFLGYASRWYERPRMDVEDPSSAGLFIAAKAGESNRGGVLYPVEGDRWLVTLSGIAGDHPPGDEAGFMDFMQSLREPILYERLKDAESCSPIYCYRRTENQWRHYEKISLPAGLIVLGDAVCCFNPIYGQGMTAAAMGAMILNETLHTASIEHGLNQSFTHRFQDKLAKTLKTPWLMATGEDFRWQETLGDRPGWLSDVLQKYFDQVIKLSKVDPLAHRTFIQVAHLTLPPSALLSPKMLWKVLVQT